ncbi:MAG: SpoIIE family protein phosphatase [Clostridia bacterium]|nr:SpoIIE family protein phosphatase [Clostridia bacterium]
MEKRNKTHPALVLSKQLKAGGDKVLLRLTLRRIVEAVMCFAMQFSGVFASMSPFGTAFYVAVFRHDDWIANYAAALLGTILSGREIFWSYAVTLTAVTALSAVWEKICQSTVLKAIVTALLFTLFGAVRFVTTSFSSFDVMALILEAVLMGSAVIVLKTGYSVFESLRKRSFINETESLCAYASVAIALLSLQRMPPLAGLKIAEVASVTVIYVMAMASDTNAALTLSVLLGVIGSLGAGMSSAYMGTYAFGALLASAFKKYGKTGVVLGFVIANSTSSLFLADAEEVVIGVYDALVAACIFAIVPQRVLDFCQDISAKVAHRTRAGAELVTDAGVAKLKRLAESVGELGRLYEDTACEKSIGDNYVKKVAKDVCSKVCANCKNKISCYEDGGEAIGAIYSLWKDRNFKVSAHELPKKLTDKCHRLDGFAQAASGCIMMLECEKQWLGKINESRRLISDQLNGIARAMTIECDRIVSCRDRALETKLLTALDECGLSPSQVYAQSSDNDFVIEITFDSYKFDKQTKKLCVDAGAKAASSPVRFAGMKRQGTDVVLTLAPSIGYSASFGYATRAKSGEKMCGDSFNVIYTNNTNAVMALSDGMGSGKKASEESRAAIEMLEKFLHSGFDCENAVRLINTSLLLRGKKDTFATLDICDIDFASSTIGFTKLGAAGAYIKTNNKITHISGSSLPAGILKDPKAERHMLAIDSDTVIVMMSDGIADIALKNPEHEGWIEKEILTLASSNPQIIAGKLLESAIRLTKHTVHDDMTLLVGCITKSKQTR